MAVGHTQNRLAGTARLVLVGLTVVACAVSPAPTPIRSVTPIPTRTAGATPMPTPTPGQTAQPTPAHTASPTASATSGLPATGGRIAFFSYRDGGPDVYVVNADGLNELQLTQFPRFGGDLDECIGSDLEIAWSPDGGSIAFTMGCQSHWTSQGTVFVDGNRQIFVMDVDGGNLVNVTNNGADNCDPAWSPDGSTIAFSSPCHGPGKRQIYVIDVDGTDLTRLSNNRASDSNPVWSPDGSQIAFRSVGLGYCGDDFQGWCGQPYVYVMNADGSARHNLAEAAGELALLYPSPAAWSPDGSRIAFVAGDENSDGEDAEIFLINPDGSNVVKITAGGVDPRCGCWVQETDPAWSPDGNRIAFLSNRDGDWDVYVMNPDGTTVVNVTNNDVNDVALAWSPDGSRIATLTGSDVERIYVANADGSASIRVTNDGSNFAWQPWVRPGHWLPTPAP